MQKVPEGKFTKKTPHDAEVLHACTTPGPGTHGLGSTWACGVCEDDWIFVPLLHGANVWRRMTYCGVGPFERNEVGNAVAFLDDTKAKKRKRMWGRIFQHMAGSLR